MSLSHVSSSEQSVKGSNVPWCLNAFMHNVVKMPKHILKILRCDHPKIFKACLAILQHYA